MGSVLPPPRTAECMSKYLHESAQALLSRRAPPPLEPTKEALAAYNSEIRALHQNWLTRTLSIGELEQLFTLGFALEQMQRNFADLERCVQEWARPSRPDNESAVCPS
jgi:hypothetical protein